MIFGKGPTDDLGDTTLILQKEYSINFTEYKEKCLNLHYNWVHSCIFVTGLEIYKFQAKDLEVNAAPLCFGDASNDF